MTRDSGAARASITFVANSARAYAIESVVDSVSSLALMTSYHRTVCISSVPFAFLCQAKQGADEPEEVNIQ